MLETEISHNILLLGITAVASILGGMCVYLYKRLDTVKKELESKMPSKEEIKALTASIQSVSGRLDSLYNILAQHTIQSISVEKK